MKPIHLFIGIIILSIHIFSCQKEPLDPNDFNEDIIKESYVDTREGTRIIEAADLSEIEEVRENGISISEGLGNKLNLKEGDILVNNMTVSESVTAFIRKVISIRKMGTRVLIQTEEAKLTDAYSAYYIDTRNKQTEIRGRSDFFTESLSIKQKFTDIFGISFKGFLEPDLDFSYEFDTIRSYFTAEYDEVNEVLPKMRLEVKDFSSTVSGSFVARGKVETFLEGKSPSLPVFMIPETPLAIYAEVKIKASMSLTGEIRTPEYSETYGPYDFVFDFDPAREEAVITSQSIAENPANDQSEWTATGKGSCNVKVGLNLFVSVVGLQDNLAAGIFMYGYGAGTTTQKGTFSDPRPRLDLAAEFGIGVKFNAKFDFFKDFEIPTPFGWFPVGVEVESPSFDYPLYLYSITDLETCTPYVSAQVSSGAGSISFSINTNDPEKKSFTLFVNGEEDTGGSFSYNTLYQVPFSDLDLLINEIEIIDNDDPGCILTENIINPNLVGTCSSTFTDPRDGNEYCTVDIGGKTWMAENLRYTDNGTLGVWYNNMESPENIIYGRLYLWDEIMAGEAPNIYDTSKNENNIKQGICPNGWHIPSAIELDELVDAVGGRGIAGRELKYPSDILWPGAQVPATSSFNAAPSGNYYIWLKTNSGAQTSFGDRGKSSTFWSSTEREIGSKNTKSIMVLTIDEGNDVEVATDLRSIDFIGYSCRCVQD